MACSDHAEATQWMQALIAPWLVYTALVWCRKVYKSSPEWRKHLENCGFLALVDSKESPDNTQIADTILNCYKRWPSTVSEMIHDYHAPHGLVFRTCALLGGVLFLHADLTALGLYSDRVGIWEEGFNTARRITYFIGTVGITFAPSPKYSFKAVYKDRFRRGSVSAADVNRELQHGAQFMLHGIMAMVAFSIAPMFELVSISIQVVRLLGDPVVTMYNGNLWMWLFLTAFRVFCIVSSVYSLSQFFARFFFKGMAGPSHDTYRSFWSEYSGIILLFKSLIFLPLASWFDCSDASPQHWSLQALAVTITLWHLYYFLPHASHLATVARNGFVYSEDDLVWTFQKWKKHELRLRKEGKAVESFVKNVHESVKKDDAIQNDESYREALQEFREREGKESSVNRRKWQQAISKVMGRGTPELRRSSSAPGESALRRRKWGDIIAKVMGDGSHGLPTTPR